MRRWTVASALTGCLLALSVSAVAQDRLGSLEFQNSGAAAAQEAFLRGVLLLHSFEFDDAAIAFREAQAIDPGFALAYWGEAMTYNHPLWYQQDREAALAALGRLGATPAERASKAQTQREKDFLGAVEALYGLGDRQDRNIAYMNAMRRMYETYPGDQEAATFYALSILGSSAEGRDFALYMKAASIAYEVFAINPDHPGAAHYIIHSFDDPIHAPLGLPAARKYSTIAPDASHALHMPTHIFVALGMWEDVARMNVASWEAGVKRVVQNDLPLAQHQYHAILWEMYSRLQLGQHERAKDLIKQVSDLYRQSDDGNITYHLAMMRSAYLVEADPLDEDVRGIEIGVEKQSDRSVAAQYFAEAMGSLRQGDIAKASEYRVMIEQRRQAASEKAENAEPAAVGRTRTDFVTTLVIEKELSALIEAANGKVDAAVATLREAVEMEEGLSFSFGPPTIVKPSAELLGEVLLNAGRTEEAMVAFDRALTRAPGRSLALLGLSRAAQAAGEASLAAEQRQRFSQNWRNADVPMPEFE